MSKREPGDVFLTTPGADDNWVRDRFESATTATEILAQRDQRFDLRRARAMTLTHTLMEALRPLLRDVSDQEVYEAVLDCLTQQGVEVLTDRDREEAGLQPRDALGWTKAEILAWERRKLEALFPLYTLPVSAG